MRIPIIIIIRRVVGWGKSRRELALAQAIQLHVACDSRALPQRGALPIIIIIIIIIAHVTIVERIVGPMLVLMAKSLG